MIHTSRANYREIPAFLTNRKDFIGNSMSGMSFPPEAGEDNPTIYIVKSYSTCIATVKQDGTVWVTDEYYSKTTSRQQNLCRAYL